LDLPAGRFPRRCRYREETFKETSGSPGHCGRAGCRRGGGAVLVSQEDIEARLGRHGPVIWKYAQANALPSELVRDIVRAESGGDERAVSPKGAKGLMQVTSIALEEVRRCTDTGDGDLFDPDYNVRVGTAYFRIMLDQFNGDAYLALAAYNMGPTRLRAARRKNPGLTGRAIVRRFAPAETRAYCRKILGKKDLKLPVSVSD